MYCLFLVSKINVHKSQDSRDFQVGKIFITMKQYAHRYIMEVNLEATDFLLICDTCIQITIYCPFCQKKRYSTTWASYNISHILWHYLGSKLLYWRLTSDYTPLDHGRLAARGGLEPWSNTTSGGHEPRTDRVLGDGRRAQVPFHFRALHV